MIKILIAVILVIIMFLVNKMCMKKNKYFFPIIPFIISCVIIGISIFHFSNDKKVSTHKSLFAIDLLGDFIVINIPTILCTLDIAKKKRN